MNIDLLFRPMARCIVLLTVLLLTLIPAQPVAALPGDLDPSFLEPNPTGAGPVDSAYAGASVVQPDGKIIVGGSFTTMSGQNRDKLARFNSDGSLDMTFADRLYFNYSIYTLALLPDGDILVGGSFRTVGGSTPANHIVRLNSDGTLDPAFQSQIDVITGGNSSSVTAIVPLSDGDLLVGGSFDSVGGVARGNIARLNADGSLDPVFMDGVNETGANNRVNTIVVDPAGKIIIAGMFTDVNKVPRGRVARLESDGTVDMSFMYAVAADKNGANDIVTALALQPDGKVLVGGYFTNFHGSNPARPYMVRLDANGYIDTAFQPVFGPHDYVQIRTINRLSDGDLLVSGYFATVNGAPYGSIVRLNSDGTTDINFMHNKSGADKLVTRSLVQSDGKILITGTFTRVNGVSRNLVARLNSNGDLDSEFLMAGASHEVNAVVVQPEDGKVLVGGRFSMVNGLAQAGITRLGTDGSTDLDFRRNALLSGGGSRVNTIALQPDGKILIGGNFSKVGSFETSNLARLNANGTLDLSFNTISPMGTDGEVYSIVVQPDGKILVGGEFSKAGDIARTGFARFNPNGALDGTFAPVMLDALVYAVALQPDGKIIIAGNFNTVNGQPRGKVARLNADGTLDTGYLSGVSGAQNVVRTVGIDPQGNAIIGGWFTSVNGASFNRIARLSKTDGSPDPAFLSGMSGPDNGIRTLEVQQNGTIVVGGEFFAVNGAECKHIAVLNPDGSLDPNFDCQGAAGINGGWVNSVAVSQGAIFIGGDFTQVRGMERGRVAKLDGVRFHVFTPLLMR